MSRRIKMTEEERIAAVQEYLDGKGSYTGISKKYGLHIELFRQMVKNAKVEGYEAFKAGNPNKKHSAQIKKEAVEEFISGKASQVEICAKYGIRSRSTLEVYLC